MFILAFILCLLIGVATLVVGCLLFMFMLKFLCWIAKYLDVVFYLIGLAILGFIVLFVIGIILII